MSGGEPSSIKRGFPCAADPSVGLCAGSDFSSCRFFVCRREEDVSGAVSEIPAGPVCGRSRSNCHYRNPAPSGGGGQNRPLLPLYRQPRYRQNHLRQNPGQGRQLPQRQRWGTLPGMRHLQGHRQRHPAGCGGNGRRLQQRGRPGASVKGRGGVYSCPKPVPGVHHRRGSHDEYGGFQRPAEDHGGTSRSCEVYSGHHRGPQGAGHYPVPVPAVRF